MVILNNGGLRWDIVLAVLILIQACGGDDSNDGAGGSNDGAGGSNDGAGDTLLSQAPHCPAGQVALRMEGSIDGATVNDQRTTNINVALTSSESSTFDSPFSTSFPPQPSELEIHLKWVGRVPHGQTSPTSGGSLAAPPGTAHAGQTLCITRGAVGFGTGGSEEDAFKFQVSELRAGADCLGELVPVELRGCYQAGN